MPTPAKNASKAAAAILHVLHVLSLPAHLIATGIQHLAKLAEYQRIQAHVSRRVMHCLAGVIITLLGVIIAQHAPESGPLHVVVDDIGYALHALGLAPSIKLVAEILSIEI